jgi:ABC-type transporter Mla maintaining outer membrane lipid asymmetry permease subunit MlaE
MREEIDAIASLCLDPAMMLFVPRFLALVIIQWEGPTIAPFRSAGILSAS